MKTVNTMMAKNSWHVVTVKKVVYLKRRNNLVETEEKHPLLNKIKQVVVQSLDGIVIETVNLVLAEIVKIGLSVMVVIH